MVAASEAGSEVRVLVTGATGLLGSELCRVLKNRYEVIGWARGNLQPEGGLSPADRMEWVDMTYSEGVSSGISRLRPDVVVHSAAQSDVDAAELQPELTRAVNTQGSENIACACAAVGTFLIAISTDYVFNGAAGRPYREEDPPHPVNAYGWSKLEGERAVLSAAPRSLVVRVSGLFGRGRPNFVLQAARSFRAGKSFQVTTDQINSPSYVVDVTMGIRTIIERSESGQELHGILHLANSGGATRLEVAQVIANYLGTPDSLIQKTTWEVLDRPARRPPDSRLDSSRWAQFSGSSLRSLSQAIQAFLASSPLI